MVRYIYTFHYRDAILTNGDTYRLSDADDFSGAEDRVRQR